MRYVLTFHGLGGDRRTMSPIHEYCGDRLDETTFLAVEGPLDLGAPDSPCLGWFEPPGENRFVAGPDPPRLSGIRQSVALVHRTMDALADRGVASTQIHLLGHSQGGAIAIVSALTYPEPLGGVHSIAGYLAFTPEMKLLGSDTPYYLHHSRYDDNVHCKWSAYAQNFLASQGRLCVLRQWEIDVQPHAIHPQQLDAICAQIRGVSRHASSRDERGEK